MEPERAEKVPLKVRIGSSLRAYLATAALQRGVSLNREIVERLERSREFPETCDEVVEGMEVEAIADIVGMVLRQVDLATAVEPLAREKGWLYSPFAFDQAVRGVCAALEAFRPPGNPPAFTADLAWMERIGSDIACRILQTIAARDGPPQERRIATRLGSLIDDAAAKLNAATKLAPGVQGEEKA